MFIDIAKIKIVSGKGRGRQGGIPSGKVRRLRRIGRRRRWTRRFGSFSVDDNPSTCWMIKKYVAAAGENGGSKRCKGRDGADLVIRVPRGTIIRDQKTGQVIRDLSDDEAVRGGQGRQRRLGATRIFATPTRQAPRFAKPGQ